MTTETGPHIIKRQHWVPVVAALMLRGQSILVGQRPEGTNLAGHWEFPGGKIELGESPEQALHRELKEEIGIDAEIGPIRFSCTHWFSYTGIIILFYQVNYWKGEPKSIQHQELKWVLVSELNQLKIPDANQKVLPFLKSLTDESNRAHRFEAQMEKSEKS